MALNMSTGFVAALLGPQSFEQILQDGAIEIRSGAQPATADRAATGALLARITRDGGAWIPGNPGNGLRWVRDGRYAFKSPAQDWSLVGLANGVAGWFRIVGNAYDAGADSLTAIRIDGAIGIIPEEGTPPAGDAQLFLPTTTIATNAAIQIGDAVWFTFPPME